MFSIICEAAVCAFKLFNLVILIPRFGLLVYEIFLTQKLLKKALVIEFDKNTAHNPKQQHFQSYADIKTTGQRLSFIEPVPRRSKSSSPDRKLRNTLSEQSKRPTEIFTKKFAEQLEKQSGSQDASIRVGMTKEDRKLKKIKMFRNQAK